ncbi:MAG: arginine decarboxylase, pyruvoyl-dependent [Bradymonadales bacterium]
MIVIRPKGYCLVAGRSEGFMPLNAFDSALINAGVGDTNLVKMSSILPPGAKKLDSVSLPPGALVPVAYADMLSSKPGERIASAVAVAVPEDESLNGVIMEHHGVGSVEEIEGIVREMAKQGMIFRNRAYKSIESIGIEHVVEKHGATFAAVVLWDDE